MWRLKGLSTTSESLGTDHREPEPGRASCSLLAASQRSWDLSDLELQHPVGNLPDTGNFPEYPSDEHVSASASVE